MTGPTEAIRALLTTPLLPGPEASLREWIDVGLRRSHELSSSEQVMFHTALALWNGNRSATVADLLAKLDAHNYAAVMAVLARARAA